MRRHLPPFAVLGAALAAACAGPPRAGDVLSGRPLRTVSPAELARAIDGDAAAVTALRGRLTLGLEEPGAAPRTCRGALAARSPRAGEPGLYLKGWQAPLPTLFTLVSDGARFWLHVPREDAVYVGPVTGPRRVAGEGRLRLDARDLFRALFVEPLGAPGALAVDEEGDAYVVSVPGEGPPRRRLWVERRGLTVGREVFYDAAGAEELSIRRERWLELDGRLRAGRVTLRDAAGAAITLEFEALTLDPALDAEAFRPRVPRGARTIVVAGAEDGP